MSEREAIRQLRRLRAQDPNGRDYKTLSGWVASKVFSGHKVVTRLARECGAIVIGMDPPEND